MTRATGQQIESKATVNEHIKAQTLSPPPTRSIQAPAQRRRRSLLYVSALLFVALPSALAAFYFLVFATDQYAVEVRFAVRGPEGATSNDMLSMVTGVSTAGSTITDSYILMDYLRSRQLIEELSSRVNFEEIFNPPEADLIAAFPVKARSIERFIDHWNRMVQIDFDTTSKIIVLEVRTFSPEHSQILAHETLKLSEALINRLSERSRQDALRSANEEVSRMEERMRKSLAMMRTFREKTQDIDPSKSAAAQLGRVSEIESQLNAERAKLSTQLSFMKEGSPAIQFTRSKIAALQQQVEAERARLGQGAGATASSAGGTLSGVVEDYQALATELEF
ncbi:MAG: hypothetical protein KKB37_06810, partial [Alphaproteobacteria bacterium]|nr:hypothetical protein [Alphaproteobacteria bacterium]